jgi:hypothetical protein
MYAGASYLFGAYSANTQVHALPQLLKIGTVDSSGSGEPHDFLPPVILFLETRNRYGPEWGIKANPNILVLLFLIWRVLLE